MKTIALPSLTFKTLDESIAHLNKFTHEDVPVKVKDLRLEGNEVKVGGKAYPITTRAWSQMLSVVAPGSSFFFKQDNVPQDLVETIVNRMARINGDETRKVRIESNGHQRYIKAMVSDRYAFFNNLEFAKDLQSQRDKGATIIRPSLHQDVFSVSLVDKDAKILTHEQMAKRDGKNRDVCMGSIFTNGEGGGTAAASVGFFTFDFMCANGAIFGQKFLADIGMRQIHYGEVDFKAFMKDAFKVTAKDTAAKKVQAAYSQMFQVMVTELYYKHIVDEATGMRKRLEEAVPLQKDENRFGLYNRLNEFAHGKDNSVEDRMGLERIAGQIVEEYALR